MGLSNERTRHHVKYLARTTPRRNPHESKLLELGFTSDQIARFSSNVQEQLVEEAMQLALEEKCFTIEDIVTINAEAKEHNMSEEQLFYLNTPVSLECIVDGSYTVVDMIALNREAQELAIDPSLLYAVTLPDVLIAIKNEKFTLSAFIDIHKRANVYLVTIDASQKLAKIKPYLNAACIIQAIKNEDFTVEFFIHQNIEADNYCQNHNTDEETEERLKEYLNEIDCLKCIDKGDYSTKDIIRIFSNPKLGELDELVLMKLIDPIFVNETKEGDFLKTVLKHGNLHREEALANCSSATCLFSFFQAKQQNNKRPFTHNIEDEAPQSKVSRTVRK